MTGAPGPDTPVGPPVGTAAAEQRRQLATLAELIASAPLNLVSREDRSRVLELHVAEAVAVTTALAPAEGSRCLDLGSGGGLPGLVMAVLRPDAHIACLDARAKKMRFVEGAAAALGLSNVAVLSGRAEALARRDDLRCSYDTVVSRAVARASVVAELARGFLRPGGMLSVVKGPRYGEELDGFRRVATPLRYGAVSVRSIPAAPRPTWVIESRASGRCPEWIPRTNGVPQRQPLEEGDE